MSVERITLTEAAADVALLRGEVPPARALLHVAHAAEHALRRLLRDDPTATVELRLQALAPEELPLDALLAELRRHDRIPMPLAAGMHELAAAAARVEAGGALEARDASNAVSVAEGLEAHLQHRPAASGLEDPLLAHDADVHLEESDPLVRAVPPAHPGHPLRLLGVGVGLVALVALAVWAATREDSDGALRRADAMLDEGRPAAAAAVLQQVAARDPRDARAAVRLARIYREAGRPDESLRALRAGLAAEPGNARLHEELGMHLLEQRRPADAVRAFRSALLADSTSERGWLGLGRALRESGDVSAATRVLAQSPEGARLLAGPMPSAPTPPPAATP